MSDARSRRRKIVVVLRQAPNWRNVGPSYWEDLSRFEVLIGRNPGSIARTIQAWDTAINTSFFKMRSKMAAITRANLRRLRGVSVIGLREYQDLIVDPTAIYGFIDDDDWYSPEIAAELQDFPIQNDGVLWRSARYDGELTIRPLDGYCYTNNYAILGAALLKDADFKRTAEQHFTVWEAMVQNKLHLDPVDKVLSITNKHPASTIVLERAWAAWGHDGPRRMLGEVQAKARRLPDARKAGVPWAAGEMRRTRRVILSLKPRRRATMLEPWAE